MRCSTPFAFELDAIDPNDLLTLYRWAIEHYLETPNIAEASGLELIAGLVGNITRKEA